MKRYVLLCGGAGARMMDALICAVSAGVYPDGSVHVLLADPDQRGVQGAAMLRAHLTDYERVQRAVMSMDGGFRTELTLQTWPRALPGDASTLAELTSGEEADALLCQALFDEDAASLDLREGFHGRRMLGQVTFAGLLHEAANDPEDPLACMVERIARDAEKGEDVRVVLAGSVCSGTGAAAIPALARFIDERVPASVHLGAILMTAVTDQQDAAKARDAIAEYAREGLADAVCVLGLPKSSQPVAPAELARLTDWLAVYCLDVLLHRPVWLDGVFTVRAEGGPLDWRIFGKAEQRYRLAYGRLFKAAMAWVYGVGPEVERRLRKPFFLRDRFGWYGHFYRGSLIEREDELETVASMTRLMRVLLLWLGGVCKTLPTDLRYAGQLDAAQQAAAKHYDALTELISQLSVMDDDVQRGGSLEEAPVQRHYTPEMTDTERTLRRIDAVKQEIARREEEQDALNLRQGGHSLMTMLEDALEKAEAESAALHARHDEAVRRIDHAESIASEEDQYRITDARTKLQRMDRHQIMLDSRAERIRADVAAAKKRNARFDRPALHLADAENELFLQKAMERLLQREPMTRAEMEAQWGQLVCPGETVGLKSVMRSLKRSRVHDSAPSVSLLHALMQLSMEEV